MSSSGSTSRHRRLPLKRGAGAIKWLVRERKERTRRGRTKRALALLLVVALFAYAISPIDLLPDETSFEGWLDEIVLLPAGFWFVLRLLLHAERERRAYRAAAAGTPPPEERRREGVRTAALVVLATAVAIALAYIVQSLWLG